ncbi:MAG: M23 family metallopeptidase [Gammaproteobacteria bacterium]|nr:M23 family metallopeptidase [Gammaproteobacteria bacterium]
MKLILFSQGRAAARHFEFSAPLVVACVIGFMVLSITGFGYLAARALDPQQPVADVDHLKRDVAAQQEALEEIKGGAQEQIDALTIRMGELNASAIRLNALGRRLTEMADLDEGEFNFENPPALGGPIESEISPATGKGADVFADINAMDRRLHDQQQQLMVLEGLLLNRRLNDRVYPKGRPVKSGWISSEFGRRTDPFNGKTTSHRGVDFAGKAGSDVIAVAAGVVTYSGSRHGYGNMVEINHGNGYVTRYAHNQRNLVAPGDQIQPGQTIALIGSTGRATGPNLHFEVWHQGRPVNPLKFIRQTT